MQRRFLEKNLDNLKKDCIIVNEVQDLWAKGLMEKSIKPSQVLVEEYISPC